MNFGRYEVKKEIGQGGMATVYHAWDPQLQRDVAIKVLTAGSSNNPEFAARFQREALIIARLEHPAILSVYDFGTDQGVNYIVMRLLSGGTLEERLQSGPLALTEVLRILQPIASALDYAHSVGVLHRDIKPSNIGFDDTGAPLLMDFGIAWVLQSQANRLTMTGALMGTPTYMSPEQAEGTSSISGAADIYALGIVAFEGLTGQVPYTGDSPFQVAYAHITQTIPKITSFRPNLPITIDGVFSKALAKDPTGRYPTAHAFVKALQNIAADFVEKELSVSVPAPYPQPTNPSTQLTPIPVTTGKSLPVPSPRRSIVDILANIWRELWIGIDSLISEFTREPSPTPRPTRLDVTELDIRTSVNTSEDQSSHSVPPKTGGVSGSSIMLQPQVYDLLAPVSQKTVKNIMALLKPEKIVNYVVVYGSGRFIITGYGSFGGTSLIQEICQLIEQEWASGQNDSKHRILIIHLNSQDMLASENSTFKASVRRKNSDGNPIGTFTIETKDTPSGSQPLSALLDTLTNPIYDTKDKSPLRQNILKAFGGKATVSRLVLTVDKVVAPETLQFLLTHPLFERQQTTLISIVESEHYNRWSRTLKNQLRSQSKFQVMPIPCLWESEYGLVESTMSLLFSRFQMETPEAAEKFQAFQKHIAYLGRGQTGTMLYELRQLRYWQIDKDSHQAFIMLDALDDALIRQHAWIQDLLHANWDHILGTSFQDQERTDRAKQGLYSLMDWIIDSSTFTLEEVLAEASQRPVWISSYKRLRDEVVVRLLGVLVKNNYLKRVENEFDIIWGRDLTDDVVSTVRHTTYADRVSVLRERMDALMDEYESANEQLSRALSEVDRTRLKRQIDRIDSDMADIQQKLDSI